MPAYEFDDLLQLTGELNSRIGRSPHQPNPDRIALLADRVNRLASAIGQHASHTATTARRLSGARTRMNRSQLIGLAADLADDLQRLEALYAHLLTEIRADLPNRAARVGPANDRRQRW